VRKILDTTPSFDRVTLTRTAAALAEAPKTQSCALGGRIVRSSDCDISSMEKPSHVTMTASRHSIASATAIMMTASSSMPALRNFGPTYVGWGSWLRRNVFGAARAASDWLASTFKRADWLFLRRSRRSIASTRLKNERGGISRNT
jgi:hypothetical protein